MGDEPAFFGIGLLLALIFCAFLPNTAVTPEEWQFAEKSCVTNGGVEYTRGSGVIRSQKVICNNGAEFVAKDTSR